LRWLVRWQLNARSRSVKQHRLDDLLTDYRLRDGVTGRARNSSVPALSPCIIVTGDTAPNDCATPDIDVAAAAILKAALAAQLRSISRCSALTARIVGNRQRAVADF
jgi:hypothetical protein